AKDEPGWEIHAANVGADLSYYYRDALRHEYWLARGQWPAAFILSTYKGIAGFGRKPGRAAGVAAGTLTAFALLHATDDRLTGCASLPGRSNLAQIQYYASVSVSSLTNLGAIVTPCGRFHGLLLSTESTIGFFLLAVLTTLFVQALLES